jgi:hypothetical protein
MAYTERYVAFVDILGFSDIVSRIERDKIPTRYDALVKALTDIGSRTKSLDLGMVGIDFKYQSFSGSIVISSAGNADGLAFLLASLNILALSLLRTGLLIRGAIAKGELHHDDLVMFGPAFLEAYHIEASITKYPRIVLSRETYGIAEALT